MTMNGDKKRKKYFDNNWREIKECPVEFFDQADFEDVIEKNWTLRPGTVAIIRAQSMKTGKIKEFAYKQDIACRDRIRSMLDTHEMTICTDEIIGCINYDPTAN